jgi:hypothetical protein
MSNFGMYLVGFIVLIVGLAIGASLLGVPTTWIAVGVIILVGIAIISASSRNGTREVHEVREVRDSREPRDPRPPSY